MRYIQAIIILGLYLLASHYHTIKHNYACHVLAAQLEQSGAEVAPANSCGFITERE